MVSVVYLGSERIQLDPSLAIGKGGEADIFNIGQERALKVYKPPNHPDFSGHPNEQQAARERLQIIQEKLPAFPIGLPVRVIAPQTLATDSGRKKILGYSMRLLTNAEVLMRYADKSFRLAGVTNETVLSIFHDLHQTIMDVHKLGVIIGDFNDLNILVLGTEAYIVDSDSFQFGKFPCQVFTARFVDPLLCDPKANSPMLILPHNAFSDWYAFAVMLMQCLLFVDPYGGVYRPKNPAERILHDQRPLKRITVFNPEVRYPKPAVPYKVLPDELLHFFHLVFEKDERCEFPLRLLQMRWTKCPACATVHARNICPSCTLVAPSILKAVTRVHGKVVATRLFHTDGLIVFATIQNHKLFYLYHQNGKYIREDSATVISGPLDPRLRFRIYGGATLLGKNSRVVTFKGNEIPQSMVVDSFGSLPIFDANSNSRYFLTGGELRRDGAWGETELIGTVLRGQTLFWVGPNFGFGFYRAGNLNVAFVFDSQRPGINDSVQIPTINGQLVDSTCFFTDELCWFFVSTKESGKTINLCFVIRKDGTLIASSQAEDRDSSWLGTIRGKCAVGKFLFAVTDDGIVRIGIDNGQLIKTYEYPDTEPFVDSSCHLFAGPGGLYVVSNQDVTLLKIS